MAQPYGCSAKSLRVTSVILTAGDQRWILPKRFDFRAARPADKLNPGTVAIFPYESGTAETSKLAA
ncbi:MAG TPA: hypothetical protein VHU84_08395, partial [Lacipirellulaceae bacterium]|nr:hypothetical protein [Lacipirellulaceae bacterium]